VNVAAWPMAISWVEERLTEDQESDLELKPAWRVWAVAVPVPVPMMRLRLRLILVTYTEAAARSEAGHSVVVVLQLRLLRHRARP